MEQQKGLLSFTPDTENDGQVGKDGLVFTLSGIKVNQQPGTFLITIAEEASDPDASPPAPGQTRSLSRPLTKFPAQFAVGDLNADPLIVKSGGSTTLSWSGSGSSGNYNANYEIEYLDGDGNTVRITHSKGQPGVPLPAAGSYTVDNLEANPTTFYLIVTVQVAGQNNPLKVTRERTVTVEPATPTIKFFKANSKGEQFELSWETDGATSVEITSFSEIFQPRGKCLFDPTPEQPLPSFFTLTAKNGPKSASSTLVQQGFQPAAGSPVTVGNVPRGVAVSPDGTRVFVACYDTRYMLTVLDARTLQPVPGSPVPVGGGSSVAVSPDGTRVFVGNSRDNTLTVLDAQTLQSVPGSPVPVGMGPRPSPCLPTARAFSWRIVTTAARSRFWTRRRSSQ